MTSVGFFGKYQSVNRKPGLFFLLIAALWNLLEDLSIRSKGKLPILRFLMANRFNLSKAEKLNVELSLDLIFVCTSKDFEILPISIRFALKATKNYNVKKVIVITPQSDTEVATKVLSSFGEKIFVVNEDNLISYEQRERLRIKFKNRYGWALQQILKVESVLKSNSDGVLIVDSDTLLIRSRNWLDQDRSQILMPSWEYNISYYSYLDKLGISLKAPKYTFVTHHMLMQPWVLKEAFSAIGWSNVDSLIKSLLSENFLSSESPFCVEYEFYGQYLWNNHREKIRLEKWANISVSRSTLKEFGNTTRLLNDFSQYASISLHSYL